MALERGEIERRPVLNPDGRRALQGRRRHIPKQKRALTNWPAYEPSLTRCGHADLRDDPGHHAAKPDSFHLRYCPAPVWQAASSREHTGGKPSQSGGEQDRADEVLLDLVRDEPRLISYCCGRALDSISYRTRQVCPGWGDTISCQQLDLPLQLSNLGLEVAGLPAGPAEGHGFASSGLLYWVERHTGHIVASGPYARA
jgi:hypothetical protein